VQQKLRQQARRAGSIGNRSLAVAARDTTRHFQPDRVSGRLPGYNVTPTDSTAPRPLPRHRVGRASRVADLNRRVAAPAAVDPLSGNYTLVQIDDVVVAYPGLTGAVTGRAFVPQQQADHTFTLAPGNQVQWPGPDGVVPDRPVAAVAGPFGEAGRDTAALAYLTPTGAGSSLSLAVLAYDDQSGALTVRTQVVLEATVPVGRVRVCRGHFDGVPVARLALAHAAPGGSLALAVYDLSGARPVRLACDRDVALAPGGQFDVAAGDFNGDGADELAVLWSGPADPNGHALFLRLYKLEPGRLSPLTTATVATAAAGAWVSIDAGPLLPGRPSRDQIAVAWAGPAAAAYFGVWELGPGPAPATLTPLFDPFFDGARYPLTNLGIVKVAVGDLDNDGVDEIVLGTQSAVGQTPDVLVLRAFRLDTSGRYTLTSTGMANVKGDKPGTITAGASFVATDLDLKIGTLDGGVASALVVAAAGTGSLAQALEGIGVLTVGLVQTAPGPDFPPSMRSAVGVLPGAWSAPCARAADLDVTAALALGDYSGRSVYVGPPRYTPVQGVNGLIAVINYPPVDTFQDAGFNGFSVNFSQHDQKTTSLNLSTNSSWSKSDSLTLNAALAASIDVSMTRTYGEDFSKSTDDVKVVSTGLNVLALSDDMLLLSVTDYDVWEYPVYDAPGGPPRGHLLVIFPHPPGKLVTETLAYNSYYIPRHQVGRLLSYEIGDPPDYPGDDAAIYAGNDFSVLQNQSFATVSWSGTHSKTASQSSKTSLSVRKSFNFSRTFDFLGGLTLGIAGDFQGTYTTDRTSTQQVTFDDSTSITVNIGSVNDPEYQYVITPLVYWSTQGGHLKLDYRVALVPGSYWDAVAREPAPRFCLPWETGKDPNLQALTRCIGFTPNDNGGVRVLANVRNFSQVTATGVSADFFLDRADGEHLGGPIRVPDVPPRGESVCSLDWNPPPGQSPCKVYCVLRWTDGKGKPQSATGFNFYPPAYFAPTPAAIKVEPNRANGGATVQGTVVLSTVGTDALTITLLSSRPAAVQIPASVVVPVGESTALFPIKTLAVGAATNVTITATLAGAGRSATLTVTPN
jgi:hypothetical protein